MNDLVERTELLQPDPRGRLAGCLACLFVPGDRPDRFGKAAAAGAGAVILDLDDAASAERERDAREHVRAWPGR